MNRVVNVGDLGFLGLLSGTAQAQPGHEDLVSFTCGFWHPFAGLDHLLAMSIVELFAVQLGGRVIWLVPASFVSAMIAGGGIGLNGGSLPFVEMGSSLSVVALGIAVACTLRLSIAAVTAFVGFFAIFHGYAHAIEIPLTASWLFYPASCVAATVGLLATGVALGLALNRQSDLGRSATIRSLGAVVALAGMGLTVEII